MSKIIWVGDKPKFDIGSKVQLNAGGPVMSVYSIDRSVVSPGEYRFNGFYTCQWFAGKKLEEGRFREQSLLEVKS
ncbi:DUF2158 domain-containing protein [Citrobacter koseri]|uniref:DUF2158 domain-containing protein n=1 Tax=Citrobacter koseri TaxID=545 RepID=UPI000D737295|nr:DUF2158 domain-containing protein [Citrobacter koseri]PWY09663.1 DUF2158 domain-containing protein [Citrobacter koseri]